MAIQSAELLVIMWHESGVPVSCDEIANISICTPATLVNSDSESWSTAKIQLFKVMSSESGEVEDELNNACESAAQWIRSQSDVLRELQRVNVEVLFDLWIDVDQMEFFLPVNLLLACGEAGLPIHMITND